MTVEEATQEPADGTAAAGASDEATIASLEDGRTRCSWVRGRPEHYYFHDAEWGRLPDSDPPTFELVMLTCFAHGTPLPDVLDRRMDIFEATGWDPQVVAEADDDKLLSLRELGGIFDDEATLRRLRDVAAACVGIAEEFKGLREYFLVFPSLTPEEALEDVMARFPGYTKEDAANLLEITGSVLGSAWQLAHERDCWIA